jgi:hypothetical protein
MAFQSVNLVSDNSTVSNFKSWAQAISSFFATAGWTQSADTGQVDWTTISAAPSTSYVYEIWEPNDSLTNFYLKVEYGDENGPMIRLSIGTATNGAGALTGYVMGPYVAAPGGGNSPSASATYPCYFSGAAGRISVLMWRAGGSNCTQLFAIERSVNSSGTYTGSHVTMALSGYSDAGTPYTQQTLVFAVGVAPAQSVGGTGTGNGGMPCKAFRLGQSVSGAFNSSIPLETIAPMIGYYDYPLTVAGIAPIGNVTDGQIITTTVYGVTRTYVGTIVNDVTYSIASDSGYRTAVLVRYD